MSEGTPQKKVRQRQFRTKRAEDEDTAGPSQEEGAQGETEEIQREKLEQMRVLQRLRKRQGGTGAEQLAQAETRDSLSPEPDLGHGGESHLMGGFSKAQAVTKTDEDPHMQAFIEAELAKRLGKRVDEGKAEDPEAKRKRMEAEMYQIPDEFKSNLVGDTVVPGMTAIITEVGLSADVRLKNIEAVEDMKRRMLGGDEDNGARNKGQSLQRKQFVQAFGKQKKVELTREELEEHHKRMKFVSEKRPAVPIAKLKKP